MVGNRVRFRFNVFYNTLHTILYTVYITCHSSYIIHYKSIYYILYGNGSKGPRKEFELQRPFMSRWEPSHFFFEFAKVTLFFFEKVGYNIVIIIVYIRVRQEKGTGEFRFGSGSVSCVVLLDNHLALQR